MFKMEVKDRIVEHGAKATAYEKAMIENAEIEKIKQKEQEHTEALRRENESKARASRESIMKDGKKADKEFKGKRYESDKEEI